MKAFQKEAISATYERLVNGDKKVAIKMATGTGKTLVVIEVINKLIKNTAFRKILVLSPFTILIEQFEDNLKERNISFSRNIHDLEHVQVNFLTYHSLSNSGYFAIQNYDLIICLEAEHTSSESVYNLFKNHNASFLGLLNTQTNRKNWFSDVEPAYIYTFEDTINLAFMDDGIAAEKFCSKMFQALNFSFTPKVKLENSRYRADFILEVDSGSILVEVKTYRDKHASRNILENAVGRLNEYRQEIFKGNNYIKHYCLILFCAVDEQYKKDIYEQYQITIWDIANILHICRDNQELINELAKFIYYPIADISPEKPIGWYPEGLKDSNSSALQKVELLNHLELEMGLKSCERGKGASIEYEAICHNIIKFLFENEFTQMSNQHKTQDELFRMDLLCGIKGSTAFWDMLIRHYNTRFVVFEFKNHSKPISQNIIYITEKYLFNS